MGIEIEGVDGLLNDLTAMAAELGSDGAATTRALKVGAEPIERKMLANASSDPKIITGDLHDSIHTGPVRKRGTGKRITIGVHHAEKSAFYANPVEFGHGGPAPAPAHPFVRPAFDTESDAAYEAMKEELRAAIMRRT